MGEYITARFVDERKYNLGFIRKGHFFFLFEAHHLVDSQIKIQALDYYSESLLIIALFNPLFLPSLLIQYTPLLYKFITLLVRIELLYQFYLIFLESYKRKGLINYFVMTLIHLLLWSSQLLEKVQNITGLLSKANNVNGIHQNLKFSNLTFIKNQT